MPVILWTSGQSISWEQFTGQTAEEVKRLRDELHQAKQAAWRDVEKITRARHLAERAKELARKTGRTDLAELANGVLEVLK